jgi:hypothetical protein
MIRDVTSLLHGTLPSRPQPTPPPRAAPAQREAPSPSPALRVDAALNLVVIEFRDRDGAILHSIPSPQQLDAYRNGAEDPRAALDLKG